MELRFIIVGVALIVVVLWAAIRSSAYHFECPVCNRDFQVGFLEYLYLSGVLLGKHRRASLFGPTPVTCPKCGMRSFMSMKKGRGRE